MNDLRTKPTFDRKLSVDDLARALYHGTADLGNLAERLARQHGDAACVLMPYNTVGDDVRNFWRGIAKQLIDHAAEWDALFGMPCVLSDRETKRLAALPRVRPA